MIVFLNQLKTDLRFQDIEYKESIMEDTMPFIRLSVKIKEELIKMNKPEANPCIQKGIYVNPKEWNQLISDPEVILIDTRNDYEILLGKFKDSINPNTKSFTEFPEYVNNNLFDMKQKKVAMYCTGRKSLK